MGLDRLGVVQRQNRSPAASHAGIDARSRFLPSQKTKAIFGLGPFRQLAGSTRGYTPNLKTNSQGIRSLSFDNGGNYFFVVTDTGAVFQVRLNTEWWLEKACSVLAGGSSSRIAA
jgi:hypothetical protein